ncbi:hypothetical protein D3C86_1407680 [compost metagenome]
MIRPWSKMSQRRLGPATMSRVLGAPLSELADQTMLPSRLMEGYRSVSATPINADCAATCSSAARTSGRRTSRLAGTSCKTAVSSSGTKPVLRLRSGIEPGGWPIRVDNALRKLATWLSKSGMVLRVPRYWVLACCRSSSASAPLLNRRSVIS